MNSTLDKLRRVIHTITNFNNDLPREDNMTTTNTLIDAPTEHATIPLERLIVDPRYQRTLEQPRVDRMAANFDFHLLGTLEVSDRENGTFAVFDGQHRRAVAQTIGLGFLPANIHRGLTPEQEADLFVRLQKERKAIKPVAAFRAALFAKDEQAIAVNAIVEKCGFVVKDVPGHDNVRPIKTVLRVYNWYGPEVLERTLNLIREIWYGDDKALSTNFIGAMGRFVSVYGDKIGEAQKKRLATLTPVVYIRRADVEGSGGAGRAVPKVAEELRKVSRIRKIEDDSET